KGGSREEIFGNQPGSLSSGGLIWSGNARPMPEISILVPDYTPVPFTKRFMEFKGGISHGWFSNNQFMDNTLLHHKYLYLKFGGSLPVHLHYGLHHFAQWGGVSKKPEIGRLPHDLSTFIYVFFARGGTTGVPLGDSLNASGNHLGSHNLGIDIKLKKHEINLYWQSIFEDGSGLSLKNIRDGLWGIKLNNPGFPSVSGFLVEFINTTDQSGTFDDYYENGTLGFAGGNDNYFNNWLYISGWSNKGMTLGTPLITSPGLLPSSVPEAMFANNKVRAIHLGIEGSIKIVDYKVLYTFSRNYGTNLNPFPDRKDQHSVLLKSTISHFLPWDISAAVAVAFDIGELYEKNLGVMFSMKKEGLLKSSKLSK
ncbi:MAG TPA: capsule assembly Wzi family protein, partial [Bacteroidales bacterium]|nr:capsule assembly Wzi family protein [Bacteroidales bacterium]